MSRRTAALAPHVAVALILAFGCSAMAADPDGKPARQWTVYLLPHSHVDIGYTHAQAEVERAQWRYLELGIEAARKSAAYPPGDRFKWNSEVLWAVDGYLKQAPPEKQRAFIEAVKAGQVGLDALYGNELTGLCRPEELLRLESFATEISHRTGVPIESAMITDVPAYTWGIVPALAQAGVKYFSVCPNCSARVGRSLVWCDKPFWWIGPNGRDRVLVWMKSARHLTVARSPQQLLEHLAQLEREGYPYDIVQVRHCLGDNHMPDVKLADAVKKWNESHASPKLVIATTTEMFRAFEKRYGDKLPTFRGDFTPYWEDGAGSAARETGLNRAAAERLVQAETLWAMLRPGPYPAGKFSAAWRNVVLFDEHTWGNDKAVTSPDLQIVKDTWRTKQAFALDGDAQSRTLLASALAGRSGATAGSSGSDSTRPAAVDVFNTSSWPRTDLVVLSKEMSGAGDLVTGSDGQIVRSQRLSTGELAFLAKDVPPLAGRRFTVAPGKAPADGNAKVEGTTLTSPAVAARIDPVSGAIVGLHSPAIDAELCDANSGVALNRYYYVLADKVKEAGQAGPANITVKESGPLVASLLVESDAPGCAKLTREYRVVDGLDRVDIVNVLDKKAVRKKEAVHLGFAFNVPQGVMRMDIPWAVIRPELDQLPGACKNWFTVGRWVDVSNRDYGVTWATPDAPLVEVGAITATVKEKATDPETWLAKIGPSQTLYSWAMNNHWYTNYRAEQEGPTTFRYALLPHQQYDPAAAQRFGIECSQPLVAVPARGAAPGGRPFLELDSPDVLVASVKPSADGRAWIVRLFGAAGRPAETGLRWGDAPPKAVYLSNLAEDRAAAVTGPIRVPAWSIVTLRAELPPQ